MRRSLAKSNAHFQRAVQRLPLGVSSNFRYWGDDKTIYIKKSQGGRIWDLDDNEYIDYRLGYGPVILGYCDPRVDAAARAGQEIGPVFALGTERELTVAEHIHKMVPTAELTRFSNSGTEAVMGALRLARAYTGKDGYVLLEGCYHGMFDSVMWSTNVKEWPANQPDPDIVPFGKGIPELIRQLFWLVSLNDAGALEEVFKRHGDSIAALLIEPILGNSCSIPADPQYMRDVRELCTKYGVLLVIDEVKTGFRAAKGGAQEMYGVPADICTFAKALGNGYPIAAFSGREEIMRQVGGGGIAHGGTYTCHAIAMAATEKNLEILDETSALDDIAAYGRRLQEGMSQILGARGVGHCFLGPPSMFGLFLAENPPTNFREWKQGDYTFYDTMAGHLIDLGVLCEPDSREPWFICEAHAHDERCLTDTLERFETAVDATIAELKPGRSQTTTTAN